MSRPRLHSTDVILDAAQDIVLAGARQMTVGEIVTRSGAPKGTIYHRFGSLENLLAQLWMRAIRRFQEGFIEAISCPDAAAGAVAGATWMYDFAKTHPADARLLVSLRRQDLIASATNPQVREELEHLNDEVNRQIKRLAINLYGSASRQALATTRLIAVDLAHGAVRRYLIAQQPLPPALRDQIRLAAQAVCRHVPR